MTRLEFLDTLRRRLAGLPPWEIDELVGDYAAHFADGMAAGRSEEEIARALGDPMRLARELRAEAGFKRWETERTAGNFFAVLFGFLGLIAVDFVFLLPLLGGLALVALVAGIVTVTEAEMLAVVGLLARQARLVAEPGGAAAVAAWLYHRDELPPTAGPAVAVLSGGNIDPDLLAATLAPAEQVG